MANYLSEFNATAKSLSRNPLGVISLFLVLVYGLATLVVIRGDSLTDDQRTPLVYFIAVYPVLVLGVFAWLVSRHSGKLFAPSDFKDERNYVKMQLSAVASLAVASTKDQSSSTTDISQLVQAVSAVNERPAKRRRRVLWVDDRPDNNVYERRAMQAVGIKFDLALTTQEALSALGGDDFGAIISDMGRREGPREGYVLLDAIRKSGDTTPYFIYASSNAPEHNDETRQHDGQGCTNNAQELFQMVTKAVIEGGT